MHIFSYDFFFKKRDDSIFSWLPIPTYPKKMVSLKKKLKKKKSLKIWRILGHFFPPKIPFHTSKLYVSSQQNKIQLSDHQLSSSASHRNMLFTHREDWSWINSEYGLPKVVDPPQSCEYILFC